MAKEAYLESLKRYVRERRETDYIMPIWLPFIPVILGISVFCLTLLTMRVAEVKVAPPKPEETLQMPTEYPRLELAGTTISGVLGLMIILISVVALIVNIYVLYKWIDRRNKHFRRVRLLFSEVIAYLRSLGEKSERVENYISSIERTLRESEAEESEKTPIIWVILSILIPFLVLYVYHFLNKDFYKHERREEYMIEDFNRVVAEVGGEKLPIRKVQRIPDRNTVIYIVLSILTLGLFILYWVYTLTRDPNDHFIEHAKWEEELVERLEGIA